MIPLVIINEVVLGLTNTTCRCHMSVQDSDGTFVNPDEITLNVMDLGATIELTDIWPDPAARIQTSATGKFYIDWGSIVPNTETDSVSELLLNWQVNSGGYVTNSLQKLKIIS